MAFQGSDELKQNYRAFTERIGSTFIFPGSLQELNENPGVVHGHRHGYRTMDGQPFVKGVLIPSLEELYALGGMQSNSIAEFFSQLGKGFDVLGEQLDELLEGVSPILDELLTREGILGQDIRVKAKELGAAGLVRVQLYSTENIVQHWGMPVVEAKPGHR